MLDFLMISTRYPKRDVVEIYPNFKIMKSSDLMIRGGDFYALWIDKLGLWSTEEQDALQLIDRELDEYVKNNAERFNCTVKVLHMWDAESGMIDAWHKYCQKQMRDNFHMLDEKLIFLNTVTTKKDYASKRLSYPLEDGECPAYDDLMSTLYSPEERNKIEWAVGSVVSGASKKLQKFLVLYGAAGTGKSTVLNIIQSLFDGYYSVFDAKALGSSSNSFALEAFKSNPLVAIQHDGDLSKIEDNTRLNSLVSHEMMTVNEKFKSTYANRFKCFLFMGTNKPVKITDAKSGLIRRLIDVSPSGNKMPTKEYRALVSKVDFELGQIATHCKKVYEINPGEYDEYIPTAMLGASNDFYNFVSDSYLVFEKEDGVSLKVAWEMYKTYCDEAKVTYPYSQRIFKEELRNYFWDFKDRHRDNESRVRNYYSGFRTDKFAGDVSTNSSSKGASENEIKNLIKFGNIPSAFDVLCADCAAQYASGKDTPTTEWVKVIKKLADLDTSKVHYVRVPENHIVIDFDLKVDGKKSLQRNIEEASKWPATYAEFSKSGCAVHLHYIYTGDPSMLSRVYDDEIEIKVFTGKSSLRRKLTKCNDLPIATISSGLPLKEVNNKLVNFDSVKSERALRTLIKRNLAKEIHPGTSPSVSFIKKILDDAYASDLHYDVTNLRGAILSFAAQSTNHANECICMVNDMKFQSEEPSASVPNNDRPIVFFDCEVFPNLFVLNWKFQGEDKPVVRMINPKPSEVEELCQYRLIGFNCRRYDNHILYARMIGFTNEQLYELSQKIIAKSKNAFFREAYALSYTDIYDFAAAGNKKSLKKLEIEMGIHHQELGLPWDKPVPKELWCKVAEYCDNDVVATEAAFNYLSADWTARQILATLADLTVNDTTNTLSTKIIFGNNKTPQSEFNYRDLSKPVNDLDEDTYLFLEKSCPDMMHQTHGKAGSLLPYFEGYKYDHGISTYKGETIGEGGLVRAIPGIYWNVALLDIVSMHPHSAIAECLFGLRYTLAYQSIVDGRVSIKNKAWDKVNNMLDGKLTPFIQMVLDGKMTAKELANALKTAINSVYGLTSAKFDNPFRDLRNIDNIVAKRGALFMVDLKEEVEKRGFIVAHIKTDSIKIPNATPEIIQFVMDFGRKYGYEFDHEAEYEKMCLVNDAVYVAKYSDNKKINKDDAGTWTSTGTQFSVPYVFKKLFSREQITLEDMCETKSVKSEIYLDMNEKLKDVSGLETQLDKCIKNEQPIPSGLDQEIAKGHDYHYIGKVGQFTPVLNGGGLLMREQNGKYYSVTGTKGYRWVESELVRANGNIENIDRSYYNSLVDKAIESISEYGDFEQFAA